MKRRVLIGGGILIGIIALLILISGPVAGLLGIEPVCIQGDLAHLRIVACPEWTGSQTTVTSYPPPTLSSAGPVPVIFDDDGSPDGLVALLYFLSHPSFDVQAVTVSYGEAHPDVFANHLARFLASLGRGDIPVGTGRSTPLEGNNAFPEPWRQLSDTFWGITIPQTSDPVKTQPAAQLIIETLSRSDQPALVFISGSHTNLAQALRLEPGIVDQIRAVYIMGGSIYVPGNIESDWPEIHNSVAEWNIWVDPVAARGVFSAGLPLHIVPLDATNQILWTKANGSSWNPSKSSTGGAAVDILNWMLDSWSANGVYIWDLVAAVLATDDNLCPEVPLTLDVLVDLGAEQGRTVVADGPANAQVCLKPDAGQIKARVEEIFDP
jgi:pyrimidine-specific ribonucleoside hydrolase